MKVALWQTRPSSDLGGAIANLTQAAEAAASEGADLLVTPEMYLGGYNIGTARIAAHAGQAAEMVEALGGIARTSNIALIAGLALPAEPRPRNACIAVDKTGQEIARYHKTHLFGDVDHAQFTAGTRVSEVFDLLGWKVALAICYDIEFPELTRILALRGAEIILCPTANMVPFDSVATRLVPARAEENALFVAYCNYVGAEAQFTYNGLSCVIGPDGRDLARADQQPALLFASLERSALDRARTAQTHLRDRRPDLYGDLA